MESLLCNEVWLMSPPPSNMHHDAGSNHHTATSCFYSTKQDCERAIGILMEKEATCVPKAGYLSYIIKSSNLIDDARFKAICWFIKSRQRMDLSFGTVFCAVSYFDRFISVTDQCQGWKYWMFELLSIACLSVASKFNETFTALLHEFQMEGLDYCFPSSWIQRMELMLLKALEWRVDSPTPYSYIELLIYTIDTSSDKTQVENVTAQLTHLLINTLLDTKYLEFRPCVIAMSGMRCIFEEDHHHHFDTFINSQDLRGDLAKCQRWLEKEVMRDYSNILESLQNANNYSSPQSPVTVLKDEWDKFYDYQLDPFLLKKPPAWINIDFRPIHKRKREEKNEI